MNVILVVFIVTFVINVSSNYFMYLQNEKMKAVKEKLDKSQAHPYQDVFIMSKKGWVNFKKNVDMQLEKGKEMSATTFFSFGETRYMIKVLK